MTRVLLDDSPIAPAAGELPALAPVESRAAAQRRLRRGKRRAVTAGFVVVAIPSAVILSFWSSLGAPFWFNEQWRAFVISEPGNWWKSLRTYGAPMPAGWFFLERFVGGLFGSTEFALRFPTALFLPLSCLLLFLLAKRWMSIWAAVAVALVGCLTGDLVSFSVQLSEFTLDASAAIAVLLMHEIAYNAPRRRQCYLAYSGIAAACIFSTPAIFVAGPLLLLDVWRDLRRKHVGPRSIGAVFAGTVAFAHLELFVVRQNAVTRRPYWDPQFMPHEGLDHQLTFVWDGLRSFVGGGFSDAAFVPHLAASVDPAWGEALAVVWAGFICLGVIVTARSDRGRSLLVGIAGSFALTLLASYLRYWPFGLVRTNLYEVPLLVLLAGIGVAHSGGLLLAVGPKRRQSVRKIVLGAALCGVIVAGIYEAVSFRQLHASNLHTRYGYALRSAVVAVREEASPGAAVVVAGHMVTAPWRYYEYEYGGQATAIGSPIPANRVLYVGNHGSSAISRFVNRLHPGEMFIYVGEGTTGVQLGQDIAAASTSGVCGQTTSHAFPWSGLMIILKPGSGCPG